MLIDTILFIDGEAIVIDKPAGLPVTRPKRGGECVEARLRELKQGFARSPMIVHRLDQDTSGCLLLARNPKALKRFNATFAEGGARKTYWAVVDGVPAAEEGMIDLPLAKRSTRERGWWMEGDPKGKSARTAWRVLARKEGSALIEFNPETGRTHQLRVHAREGLGMPIMGDPVYGTADGPMLLHARALVVPRPGKRPVEASAPLPGRFGSWDLADDAAS
ncbi:RluA family pseudouridine synthase [Parasphingopyxis marina]|uniref:RNA pseudouridine synthase n=1 Tax=Parasphingopyxis marina TaxID=2761622 RepID=A0A842HX01_9SPHN|nr:RNA pseudouridine synthase [Parasphingopyxis marina]MBC2776861.1 RNA pseudouridine synthase [Parasphingopyxis marina]